MSTKDTVHAPRVEVVLVTAVMVSRYCFRRVGECGEWLWHSAMAPQASCPAGDHASHVQADNDAALLLRSSRNAVSCRSVNACLRMASLVSMHEWQ